MKVLNMNKKARKFATYLATNAASTLEFEQLPPVNDYEILFTMDYEYHDNIVRIIATLGEGTICLVSAGFPIVWDHNDLYFAINEYNRRDFEGKCYILGDSLVYEKFYFCNDETFNPSVFYALIMRTFSGVKILHEFLRDYFSEHGEKH